MLHTQNMRSTCLENFLEAHKVKFCLFFLENRVSTNPTQIRTLYVLCRSFWLCGPLENFLDKLSACSGYVTCCPNSGLSNGIKIITRGALGKNRYAYFKKRSPRLPFASYFSIFKNVESWLSNIHKCLQKWRVWSFKRSYDAEIDRAW